MSGIGPVTLLSFALLLAPGASAGDAAGAGAGTAVPSRDEAIAATAERIRGELETVGRGDWQAWSNRLEPFRRELQGRIAKAVPHDPGAAGAREARAKVLVASGDPPLYECDPEFYLGYLIEAPKVEKWIEQRDAVAAVIGASRWLRSKGVDLLFVPVPKLTEVYPDRMAGAAPPDRIVAPQMRRLVLELSASGVEVVDLLPELLAARATATSPLYEPCDPHWAEPGRRVAADVIAARLARYDFVRAAQARPPRYTARTAAFPSARHWACYGALSSEQQASVQPFATTMLTEAVPLGGGPTPDDGAVLLLGDSYSGGLARLLKPRLNLPVWEGWSAGGSMATIKDFVRDPAMLEGAKVAILVANSWTVVAGDWTVPRPLADLARAGDAKAPGSRR